MAREYGSTRSRHAVIQTAFLGDVVLTTPLLTALAEKFGPVDVVTTPAAAALLEGHPAVAERDPIRQAGRPTRGSAGSWRLGAPAPPRGATRGPICPTGRWRSAALALLAAGAERTGFADSPAAITYTSACAARSRAGHEVERLLALAGRRTRATPAVSLGSAPPTARPPIVGSPSGAIAPGFTAVAPGSIWGTKRWPYYPALAAALDGPVVVVGGSDDAALAERWWPPPRAEPGAAAGELEPAAVGGADRAGAGAGHQRLGAAAPRDRGGHTAWSRSSARRCRNRASVPGARAVSRWGIRASPAGRAPRTVRRSVRWAITGACVELSGRDRGGGATAWWRGAEERRAIRPRH